MALIDNPTTDPTAIADAALVHTKERSGHTFPHSPYGDELRSRFPAEYPASEKGYSLMDALDHTHRTESLQHCRNWAWFARHRDTGKVHVLSSACRLRWCPVCAQHRSAFLTREISDWISKVSRPKLLTLTLKHSDAELGFQITSLYRYFSRLKRSIIWKHNVRGGVWFFQVKYNADHDQWHPHLHVLLDANYIDQAKLSRTWLSITHNSKVVDIRSVYNPDQVSQHVARYATRPCTLSSLELAKAVELMQALHGRRIAGSWGSAGAVRLSSPKMAARDDYVFLGSWTEVREAAASKPAALAIINAWSSGEVLPEDVTLEDPVQDPPKNLPLEAHNSKAYFAHSFWDP